MSRPSSPDAFSSQGEEGSDMFIERRCPFKTTVYRVLFVDPEYTCLAKTYLPCHIGTARCKRGVNVSATLRNAVEWRMLTKEGRKRPQSEHRIPAIFPPDSQIIVTDRDSSQSATPYQQDALPVNSTEYGQSSSSHGMVPPMSYPEDRDSELTSDDAPFSQSDRLAPAESDSHWFDENAFLRDIEIMEELAVPDWFDEVAFLREVEILGEHAAQNNTFV